MNLAKKGTIASIKKIAQRTIEVAIKVPEDFGFVAGQYIWLMVPELKYPDPKGNTRMFSVASSPNRKGELDIIFRTGESGYKKTLVEMAAGSKIIFSGPYGHLRLPENNSLPVIFMAGGVGVAPFLSMIRFSTETDSGQEITLIYGNNSKKETACLDELVQIEKDNPNFKLIYISGRLTEESLKKSCGQFLGRKAVWFVTGPQDFVDYAGKFLISAGVLFTNINFEQFYPRLNDSGSALEQRLENDRADGSPFFLAAENINVHIVVTDVDGMILYANKGAEKLTGYTFEEMKGNTPRLWGGLMPKDFYKELWETKKYKMKTFSAEVKNRGKNQEEYQAIMHSSPIFSGDKNLIGFVSIEENITKQKQRESNLENARLATQNILEDLQDEKEALAESEEKYHGLVDVMNEGLAVLNSDGIITFMNKGGCKMLGYKPDELIGKPIALFFDKENQKIMQEHMAKRKRGERRDFEIAWLRKDGVSVYTIVAPSARFDEKGNFVENVAVFTDITSMKQAELRLREIDKEKTEFISIAAHQLRTPISGLSWLTEALEAGSRDLNSKQKRYINDLATLSKRLIGLIEDLLNFSRIELKTASVAEQQQIEIGGFIKKFLEEMEAYAISKKHTIILDKRMIETSVIAINSRALYNVLQNLISNAIDYSPGNTQVTVTLEKTDKAVKVAVSNKGPAISKEEQPYIFERFYRGASAKKMKAEGTGLGLYIAKRILEETGGKIGFESEEGKDTVFWITIPLTAADEVKPPASVASSAVK